MLIIIMRLRNHLIDEETYSTLAVLNEDERIEEIAKMLSGDVITPEAIDNAKRLLQGMSI